MNTIQDGTFITLNYTGRLAETGDVFDTTDESIAKKHGLSNGTYGPAIICVGEHQILSGIDSHLLGKKPGHYLITLKSAEAFGVKDTRLIQLIPIARFKEHNIQPHVGLQLDVDGMVGIVRNASGGRILVDFNHPLASKDVIYELDIVNTVTDPVAQIRSLVVRMLHTEKVTLKLDKDAVSISLPAKLPIEAQELFETILKKRTIAKTVKWNIHA